MTATLQTTARRRTAPELTATDTCPSSAQIPDKVTHAPAVPVAVLSAYESTRIDQVVDGTSVTEALDGAATRRRTAKRVLDASASATGLVVLSPVLLTVALLVKLDSPGPAIFRQTRVGLNGKRFSILKFRTMQQDAESRITELERFNEGAGPLFKMKSDPRVTRIGRFLRKLSIDELPQLFNVLRGDMSLVGPRPGLPTEVAAYEPRAHRRLAVLPGITGPWQISGRSDLSWEAGLELDLDYVDDYSFRRDLLILLGTVPRVLASRGAY